MGRLMDRLRQEKAGEPVQQRQSWNDLAPVTEELFGQSVIAHQALGIVRISPKGPAMRLYDARGRFCQWATEAQWKALGAYLAADFAGVGLLSQALPVDQIPKKHTFDGFSFYPYSGVRAVVIVKGLRDLVRASGWVLRPLIMKKFGSGIPVLSYVDGAEKELSRVVWPKRATLYAKDSATQKTLSNVIVTKDIKVLGASQ